MISKLFAQLIKRKFTAGILLLLVAGSGYWGYTKIFSNDDAIRYATAQVQKGTLIVSISGNGQVSAFNQDDIKPKVSGDITWAGMTVGQEVWQGQAMFSIDDRDIRKEIADAEQALNEEKDNYDEIVIDAERALKTAYEDGYSTVSNSFFKLSGYMADLKEVLGTEKSSNEYVFDYKLILGSDSLFVQTLLDDYDLALEFFNKNFAFFRGVYDNNDRETVYLLINDTLETTKVIARALESARHMYDAITVGSYKHLNISSQVDKMKPKIESDVSSIYSIVNSLQKIKDSIDDTNKNTPKKIATAERNLQNKKDSLDKLKEKMEQHTVRAPFSGVIAKINSKKGDTVSSGTTLATLITKQKIVEITLNEIDVAQVKIGQKATLTFDAVPDLALTGQVMEVDSIGTISQGVVTYAVKIAFDTQDDRVKTAMSVSAAIVTEVKADILLIPNSAVKSQSGMSYVEVPDDADASVALANLSGAVFKNSPRRQNIEVGRASDEFTEIISGLNEGDLIVTRTIQPTAQTTQTQQQSGGLRIPGLNTGGGGGFRGGGGSIPH